MDGGDMWRGVGCYGGAGQEESSILRRIMLKFRPIMPKPACANTSTCSAHQENKRVMPKTKRSKRKYVRIHKNNSNNSKRKEKKTCSKTVQLISPENCRDYITGVAESDRTAVMTVECVTETCMDVKLGCTDEERMRNLETDKCPCVISDCLNNKVKFVNNAFKNFVSFGVLENDDEKDLVVRLVLKEDLPVTCSEFSCRVKLEYDNFLGKQKGSKMVPCDVWRMDFGGLAWRLDIKAALSLGL